ncbi:hypothetical protein C1645_830480 [Glomus cerebriforme]|uniref:Phosphatidylglycerol/phosphatidylinositol transfer protein n=1 Tax=Glomus cerebriforme TaxID=658196 RepID=A0A397SHW6_9GLOM|nr:hypothetical protein C1645_830480 [Glomus cerebriforme]
MKFILIYSIVLLVLLATEVLSIPNNVPDGKKSGKKKPKKPKSLPPTDGKQIPGGSFSSTIQGTIPSVNKMTSSLIISPSNEAVIKPNKSFLVKVLVDNLETGHFSDPDTQYYTKPQQLNDHGVIKGHIHVTIQSLEGNRPPNSKEFGFFKGVEDKSKKGLSVVNVVSEDGTRGLPNGRYRICSMSSSVSHQPLIMPIAKRGAQDDCIRITVK